jgi:hypothetical protein
MQIDWNHELTDQLVWHWDNQLRPRLDGLTDHEYFWEPAPRSWNIRPAGDGFVLEVVHPEPEVAPVTTIAWRLGHIIVAVLGERVASHFGGPAVDGRTFAYAGTAKQALGQLDEAYAGWIAGVRGLGQDGLGAPCGPAEGPFADFPMAALVLHIHREVIHHGAEIALLRDLYLRNGVGHGI